MFRHSTSGRRPPIPSPIFALAVSLVLAAVPAAAVDSIHFSFASDDDPDGPTWVSNGTDVLDSVVQVDLKVDFNEDNGGGVVIFPTDAFLFVQIHEYKLLGFAGNYLHIWTVSGRIDFIHRDSTAFSPLLTIGFSNGVMTSWSPSTITLGETLTLQSSESTDTFTTLFPQTLLQGIGIKTSFTANGEDLALTFTNVRNAQENGLPRIDANGRFLQSWTAEGSFSAAADKQAM
jgi:hypothetical protein